MAPTNQAESTTELPVLLRLPFSHYCRKVEACFQQAGLAYDTLDIWFRDFPLPVGAGTVPVLKVGDLQLDDSADIIAWVDANAAPGTIPLRTQDPEVFEWCQWADEVIGAVARRQAYRCAYTAPRKFTRNPGFWLLLKLARPLLLNVLKSYKTRRFDDFDAAAGPDIIARVAKALDNSDSGCLVGDHPTAADLTVTNLLHPLMRVGGWAGLDQEAGWETVSQFVAVHAVKGKKRGRRPREGELATWAVQSEPFLSA